MDQTKRQKLSPSTKLLLYISVFSLLLSSSNFLSFFPPWHSHLFTFPLRLVTHAVDKNCIFLLCNGILAFLAQDLGSIGATSFWHSTSDSDPAKETIYAMENKLLAMDIDNGALPDVGQEDSTRGEEEKTLNNENDNHEDCLVEVETGDMCLHAEGCARDGDNSKEEEEEDNIDLSTAEARNIVATPDTDDEEELDECGGERMDESSEDYTNGAKIRYGNNVMTAEELDKKFDEFIRKMKEGIMIETQQQQLLMV